MIAIKVKRLIALLEQCDQNTELAVEITKENGEMVTTYDIGFDHSELGEFMLQVHE